MSLLKVYDNYLDKPIVEFSSNVSTLVIDGLPAISTAIDETLKLNCVVQGYELMTVNWYRDNTSISVNVSFGTVVQSIDSGYIQSSTLLIRSSLDENFKIYKCVSETSVGKTESSLKIYVCKLVFLFLLFCLLNLLYFCIYLLPWFNFYYIL